MRIIAGEFKSRIIEAPEGDTTRPTSDKTRQGVFNVIAPYIYNAKILDLFAGSGAFGLESLSRGAQKVTFIDKDVKAYRTICKNIATLKVEDKTKVLLKSYEAIQDCEEVYDIIFLDPPYKMDVFIEIMNLIEQFHLLNKNGILIYESDAVHSFKDAPNGYKIKQYKYGIAYVHVLYKIG